MRRVGIIAWTVAALTALGCGASGATPQGDDQRQVLERISQAGGTVTGRLDPGRPRVFVDFAGGRDAGAGLTALEGLKGLAGVRLTGAGLTDAGLARLEGFTGLEYLVLRRASLTDAGLEHLAGLKGLRMLELGGRGVTDAGLVHLRGLRGLRALKLVDTRVTEEGISRLQEALPDCQIQWR